MTRSFLASALVGLAFFVAACGKSDPNVSASLTAAPGKPDPETQLRAELATWKNTPYLDGGKTKKGVDNTAFVRTVYQNAFGVALPASYDEQFHTGKLVERTALIPGDLVFFEGSGVGPFKARWVALYIGHGDVAIAKKELNVAIVHLKDAPWTTEYKTGRRMPSDPNAPPPNFDRSKYGSNRQALLRDIAQAWSGTLYVAGGTTFDGIGNPEFVKEVYGAVNEAVLEGTPKDWSTLGVAVPKDKLQPGDIILYDSTGVFTQRHAGIYIGGGDFVHAVRGSAVAISQLSDPQWTQAFKDARRIDPDALTKAEEEAAARKAAVTTPPAKPATPSTKSAPATRPQAATPTTSAKSSTTKPTAPGAPATPSGTTAPGTTGTSASTAAPSGGPGSPAGRPMTTSERQLRSATEQWRGTPYKIGGTTKSGVDCSAFVQAIYQEVFKVQLPRTAEEQETLGKKVDRDKLVTGDLIFFRTQGMGPLFKSRHVGLYLGGGEFAQSSGKLGVTVTRLDNYYWSQKYEGARRLSTTVLTAIFRPIILALTPPGPLGVR